MKTVPVREGLFAERLNHPELLALVIALRRHDFIHLQTTRSHSAGADAS